MSATSSTDDLSRLKEEFLASLNHEIRTPLSGVLGMLDLVLETRITGEQKEYLDDARLCAENLLEILNSTLEFSALSANHVVLEETEFPVRALLNGLVDEWAFKAKAKGLKLLRQFAPDVPEVAFGDPLRLKQILSQVIGNALKFTTRGEVSVNARGIAMGEGRLSLRLTVRDTGIGIADDQVIHIFDSFRQIETGLARRYTGMGLGLAVTQKLIALMKGEIGVRSRLGEGTEITIEIPLKAARDQQLNARVATTGTPVFRLLVVEDNLVAQTVALHVLQRRPYLVDCVSDGQAAVEAAQQNRYDLILMDLQLPEIDGFETAARIRSLPTHRNTPILAVTANYSPEYRDRCQQQGMQGFLAKPVQSSELLEMVETLLSQTKGPVAATNSSRISSIAV